MAGQIPLAKWAFNGKRSLEVINYIFKKRSFSLEDEKFLIGLHSEYDFASEGHNALKALILFQPFYVSKHK